jgi:hypothetical protein
VPPIAELKMLLVMQKQINSRTVLVDQQAEQKALSKEQHDQQIKELSEREAKVKGLAEDSAAKMR